MEALAALRIDRSQRQDRPLPQTSPVSRVCPFGPPHYAPRDNPTTADGPNLGRLYRQHLPGLSDARSESMVCEPSPIPPAQEDRAMDFRPLAEVERRQLL